MRMSIFRPFKNFEHKQKRYHMIHYVWKMKLAYPFMIFASKYISKYLIKSKEDIPNEIYNANMKIFYEAIEEGMKDWNFHFYGGFGNGEINPERFEHCTKNWDRRKEYHWYQFPDFLRKLILTIALEDTAYREQINFVMFKIQQLMNEKYNPEIQHKFPIYMNKYDMFLPYFVEWIKVQGGGEISIKVDAQQNERVSISMNLSPDEMKIIETLRKAVESGQERVVIDAKFEKIQGGSCQTNTTGIAGNNNREESAVLTASGKVSGSDSVKVVKGVEIDRIKTETGCSRKDKPRRKRTSSKRN